MAAVPASVPVRAVVRRFGRPESRFGVPNRIWTGPRRRSAFWSAAWPTPAFSRIRSMRHHRVKLDWSRLSPTNAVNRKKYALTRVPSASEASTNVPGALASSARATALSSESREVSAGDSARPVLNNSIAIFICLRPNKKSLFQPSPSHITVADAVQDVLHLGFGDSIVHVVPVTARGHDSAPTHFGQML